MANKYLLCADEASARAKSANAFALQNPNRAQLQAEQALNNTHENLSYPPIEECVTQYLNGWAVDTDSGAAELEIADEHVPYYPNDVNSLRNWRAIDVANGPQGGE